MDQTRNLNYKSKQIIQKMNFCIRHKKLRSLADAHNCKNKYDRNKSDGFFEEVGVNKALFSLVGIDRV
jgi:hypothetical protein